MSVATKANVRTANAARTSGMNKALEIAFSGGAVMGMVVVGLGLLGCGVLWIIFGNATYLTGFSLGASLSHCSLVLVVVYIQKLLTLELT